MWEGFFFLSLVGKKRKQHLDLGFPEQISRTCSVAMAVLIMPDFLFDFTSLFVCVCGCARVHVCVYVSKVAVRLLSFISRNV